MLSRGQLVTCLVLLLAAWDATNGLWAEAQAVPPSQCSKVGCSRCNSKKWRCTKCAAGYKLRKDGSCGCAKGYGSWGQPPADTPAGSFGLPLQFLQCELADNPARDISNGCICQKCPSGTVSPSPQKIGLAACLPLIPAPPKRPLPERPLFVGYYESWSMDWSFPPQTGNDTDLAWIPSYVDVVMLSFARPDCRYVKGSLDISNYVTGTGMLFSCSGAVLRDAVALLKQRQPGTRVLLSVGGSAYKKWRALNVKCVKDLVDDLGLDGADIDYEADCHCTKSPAGSVSCSTDVEIAGVTAALRGAMPQGQYILSAATAHVGAYGEGAFAESQPAFSDCIGFNLAQAKSPAGQQLDLVSVMAYCAGSINSTGFDPTEAFLAHRAAWPNARVTLGVAVPPETDCWGDGYTDIPKARFYSEFVRDHGGAGLMLWDLQLPAPDDGTVPKPSAQAIAQAFCEVNNLGGCDAPLPTCKGC